MSLWKSAIVRSVFVASLGIALLPVEAAAQVTPTPTASPTVAPTPTFSLDHFQCYEVHPGPFRGFPASLADQFGASTVAVRQPRRLCNPASKNGENPAAPAHPDHLAGYLLRQRSPKFHTIRDVEVVNQFGTIHVDLVRPEQLLVPTAKNPTLPPPPLVPSIDHFKCYRVKGAKFRRSGVTITDQFGSIVVDIKRPRRLCVPASKNNEPIINGVDHLMCYQVRLAASSTFSAPGRVFVNNQFGPTVFDVFRPTELCVPSLKNPSQSCSVRRGRAGAPVCGGSCPSPNQRCLFFSGPDMTGPDMGGPDLGGPDTVGPTCACRPTSEACGADETGACGGLCPGLNDTCLFLSGPDMGGPDMGGPDLGGPDMSGPETGCVCRPQSEACAFDMLGGVCGGLCPSPHDACLFLTGPDMGGPDLGGPDMSGPEACACLPSTDACGLGGGVCGGLCTSPGLACLGLSGPDLGGRTSAAPT